MTPSDARKFNTTYACEGIGDITQFLDKIDIVTGQKTTKQIWDEQGIFIILQNIKRLQFNVLNHTLVPKHRILDSKNEITTLKKNTIL